MKKRTKAELLEDYRLALTKMWIRFQTTGVKDYNEFIDIHNLIKVPNFVYSPVFELEQTPNEEFAFSMYNAAKEYRKAHYRHKKQTAINLDIVDTQLEQAIEYLKKNGYKVYKVVITEKLEEV